MSCKLTDIPNYNNNIRAPRMLFNISRGLKEDESNPPDMGVSKDLKNSRKARKVAFPNDAEFLSLNKYIRAAIDGYAIDDFSVGNNKYRGSKHTRDGVTVTVMPSKLIFDLVSDFIRRAPGNIAKDFSIPQLRALVFDSSDSMNAGASMGDGILHIAADHYNKLPSIQTKLSASEVDRLTAEIIVEQSKLYEERDAIRISITTYKKEFLVKSNNASQEERAKTKFTTANKEYELITKRLNHLHDSLMELLTVREFANVPNIIEDFKNGAVDEFGLSTLPFDTRAYYNNIRHRFLTALYHEMGHHIHQQYGVTTKRDYAEGDTYDTADRVNARYRKPPIEKILKTLSDMYVRESQDENHPEGYSLSGLKYISEYSLHKAATKSGRSGLLEWFSENFSYWAMEKYEGVAPLGPSNKVLDEQFISIMESIYRKGSDVYEL